jgi:hypothetical protein
VENPGAVPVNFTFFNSLLLFAQFQCNEFFPEHYATVTRRSTKQSY